MSESVDDTDLKSVGQSAVRVRVPLAVLIDTKTNQKNLSSPLLPDLHFISSATLGGHLKEERFNTTLTYIEINPCSSLRNNS